MSVELWLALDVPDTNTALHFTETLKGHVDVFKIGLELFTSEGPEIVYKIKEKGCRVFLDLKFHDIPKTVAGAVRNVTKLGADFIDVHASGGPEMMKAAVEAAHEESERLGLLVKPKILAITVLTSIDTKALRSLNINEDISKLVRTWAQLAQKCGIDGVVSSLLEVKDVRDACGTDFLTVTPGIRLAAKTDDDDQQRIGTPKQAASLGTSAIVVGRPILKANDPLATAAAIKKELLQAPKGKIK